MEGCWGREVGGSGHLFFRLGQWNKYSIPLPAAVGRIGVTLRRKWMTMFKIHTVVRERRGAACRGCLLQLSHFTPLPRLQLSEVNDGVANPSSTWRIALLVLSLMNCFLLFYVCCTYSTPLPLCLFLSLCHSPSYHNSCLGLPLFVMALAIELLFNKPFYMGRVVCSFPISLAFWLENAFSLFPRTALMFCPFELGSKKESWLYHYWNCWRKVWLPVFWVDIALFQGLKGKFIKAFFVFWK